MIPLKQALTSSIGKKYLMAVSGLALVGFIVTHLLGNLQLYGDGTAFNVYAKGLHDLGPLLWGAEIGLLGIFLLHVAIAIGLTSKNKDARGSKYQHGQQSKGGPSYMSAFSRNMIISGVVILGFVVMHVLHFKFGLFTPEEVVSKTVMIDGEESIDLYARVVHAFTQPLWVVIYVAVMLFLGAHLRHGFWSAFQSLGALNWRLEKPAVGLAVIVAVLLAAGFLGIPIFIFITNAGA